MSVGRAPTPTKRLTVPSTQDVQLGKDAALVEGGPHAAVKHNHPEPPNPLASRPTGRAPPLRSGGASPPRTASNSRDALGAAHRSADHALAAESALLQQDVLPQLFRKSGGLAGLRPQPSSPTKERSGGGGGDARDAGFLEVFPRSGPGETRKPRLLTRLETLLQERLRVSEKLASPANRSGGDQYAGGHRGAANMRLDAHRHVLEAFIQSFTTYRPLLMKVKGEYDRALDAALRSEHENIHMRAELAALEQRAARKVEEARAEAGAAAAEQRAELYARLVEAQERAAALEARAVEAESRALAAESRAEELSVESAQYRDRCEEMKQALLQESSWMEKPIAATVSEVTMKPVQGGASAALSSSSGAEPAE